MNRYFLSPRKKRGSSGRRRTRTLRISRRTARNGWYLRAGWGSPSVPRRRMTTTWSSVGCVKTEESCCAATPAPPRTTSTAWTPRCPRSPTESGCVRDARWEAPNLIQTCFYLIQNYVYHVIYRDQSVSVQLFLIGNSSSPGQHFKVSILLHENKVYYIILCQRRWNPHIEKTYSPLYLISLFFPLNE